MGNQFNHYAVDSGNGSERVMTTNGTITVPPRQKYTITDLVGTYEGAGMIRIREGSLSGDVRFKLVFTASIDLLTKTFSTPIILNNPSLTEAAVFVITQEGNSPRSLFASGDVDLHNLQ